MKDFSLKPETIKLNLEEIIVEKPFHLRLENDFWVRRPKHRQQKQKGVCGATSHQTAPQSKGKGQQNRKAAHGMEKIFANHGSGKSLTYKI